MGGASDGQHGRRGRWSGWAPRVTGRAVCPRGARGVPARPAVPSSRVAEPSLVPLRGSRVRHGTRPCRRPGVRWCSDAPPARAPAGPGRGQSRDGPVRRTDGHQEARRASSAAERFSSCCPSPPAQGRGAPERAFLPRERTPERTFLPRGGASSVGLAGAPCREPVLPALLASRVGVDETFRPRRAPPERAEARHRQVGLLHPRWASVLLASHGQHPALRRAGDVGGGESEGRAWARSQAAPSPAHGLEPRERTTSERCRCASPRPASRADKTRTIGPTAATASARWPAPAVRR